MNKPNSPKCESCFVIRNLLRCSQCKYKTEDWVRENFNGPIALLGEADLYQPKSEKGEQMEILDKIREEITDTGAYEQEVHGKTEFLKGIDYCLSVINKRAAEKQKLKENKE